MSIDGCLAARRAFSADIQFGSIFAAAGGADIPGTLYIHGAYPGRIA